MEESSILQHSSDYDCQIRAAGLSNALVERTGSLAKRTADAGCQSIRRSAFLDILLIPQGVVEIQNTLAKGCAAGVDAYVGAGQPCFLPIALVGVHRAARQERCCKGAC